MMTSQSSVFHFQNLSTNAVEEIHVPLEFRKKKPDITTQQWNAIKEIVKDLDEVSLEPLSATTKKCYLSINSPNTEQLLVTMMKLNVRLREARLLEIVFFKTPNETSNDL